jgi:hypothetical protein
VTIAPDRTPPVISGLRLDRKVFAVARARIGKRKLPTGRYRATLTARMARATSPSGAL